MGGEALGGVVGGGRWAMGDKKWAKGDRKWEMGDRKRARGCWSCGTHGTRNWAGLGTVCLSEGNEFASAHQAEPLRFVVSLKQ